MPNNYVLLDRIELNDTAASVTFDNIPQSGYTDLKLVISGRSSQANNANSCAISFNGSTASFSSRFIEGAGSGSPISYTSTNIISNIQGTSSTANTFTSVDVYIPNYRGSTFKSFSVDNVTENNATTAYASFGANLWSSTAAITSITLTMNSFVSGSTFSLYGLAQVGTTPAIAPKADGGNVIGTDGTYWYHAFLSNGTFTPQVALSADVLVVAGGGAGGYDQGGGGGAGGYRSTTSLSVTTATAVTVGAGASQTGSPSTSANGTNSTFASITASGGGGAKGYQQNGVAGGSGSGAGGPNNGTYTLTGGAGNAGSYSPVEGYAGGGSTGVAGNATYTTGGGGGATAVGGDATAGTSGVSGNGGAGSNAHSSWLSAVALGVSGYLAGGGGGGCYRSSAQSPGTGGSGGGGTGGGTSGTVAGTAGTVNTGSGGGGGSGNGGAGGTGGSGIVIIRYLVA